MVARQNGDGISLFERVQADTAWTEVHGIYDGCKGTEILLVHGGRNECSALAQFHDGSFANHAIAIIDANRKVENAHHGEKGKDGKSNHVH